MSFNLPTCSHTDSFTANSTAQNTATIPFDVLAGYFPAFGTLNMNISNLTTLSIQTTLRKTLTK